LRRGRANHLEPLLVDLQELSERIVRAEESRAGTLTENGDGRGLRGFGVSEEAA
jgi:hypothetical protein